MKINNLKNDMYEVIFEEKERFVMTLDEVIHLLHIQQPVVHMKTEQELFDEFWESKPVFPKED